MPPRRPRLLSLLAALLALASQVALGAVFPRETPAEALAAAAIFCQSTHAPGTPHSPAPPATTPALCPIAAALAHPAPLPITPPALPAPTQGPSLAAGAAAGPRAPPAPHLAAAYPRGPPHLT